MRIETQTIEARQNVEFRSEVRFVSGHLRRKEKVLPGQRPNGAAREPNRQRLSIYRNASASAGTFSAIAGWWMEQRCRRGACRATRSQSKQIECSRDSYHPLTIVQNQNRFPSTAREYIKSASVERGGGRFNDL
jgi:hypothetical protein